MIDAAGLETKSSIGEKTSAITTEVLSMVALLFLSNTIKLMAADIRIKMRDLWITALRGDESLIRRDPGLNLEFIFIIN